MADTNVKFLKENHLYEAHKHFMRMAEGFGYTAAIEEADDEELPQGTDAPMGGLEQPVDNAPSEVNTDQNQMGDTNIPTTDPLQEPSQPIDTPPIEEPMEDENSSTNEDNDEEVIDVDDVVRAQERTNDKVNSVGRDLGTVDRRIEKLLGALEDMQTVIDKNNAEIEDLKNEFEKRNPTQTEKLNLRSLDSYPFNVKPEDYWKEKSKNSNYDAYADNDEPTTKEYEITNDDVRNISSDIANTFDIPEDDIQDFNKIFNW